MVDTTGKSFCMTLMAPIFATAALLLGLLANMWCRTIEFVPTLGATLTFGPFNVKQYYAAVVSNNQGTYLVTGDTCVSFPSGIDKDSYWNTTQAFAIVAAVIGGLACIGSCVLPCFDDQKPKLWKVIGLLFILCSLFQGLTLLFLSSNICKDNQVLALLPQAVRSLYPEECSLSSGTKMNISAVVFWFVAGVLAVFVGNAMAASTGSGENPDSSPGEPVTKMPKEEDAEVGEEGPTE